MSEKQGNIKEQLLPEIAKITLKHPRAEDYMAKISQHDDCFGVGFDEASDVCKGCVVLAKYEGEEMTLNELCKRFMKMPLVSDNNQKEDAMSAKKKPATEKAEKPEAPKAEKQKKEKAPKAEKPAGEKTSRAEVTKEMVLGCIDEGLSLQKEIVEKLKSNHTTVNVLLRQLTEEGVLKSEKDGRKFKYLRK